MNRNRDERETVCICSEDIMTTRRTFVKTGTAALALGLAIAHENRMFRSIFSGTR